MNNEPIILADGIRGIHARTHAAREMRRLIAVHVLRYSGHTPSMGDLDIASDPTDEDKDEAWEVVADGTYFLGSDGVEYRIHEDSEGIFLVPDGYDMEQA